MDRIGLPESRTILSFSLVEPPLCGRAQYDLRKGTHS
jgi:hypothetical protein